MSIPFAVGFTCGETCSSWFVDCVIRLALSEHVPFIQVIAGPLPHRNRNMLAKLFLEASWDGDPAERLMMLDSDIVFSVGDVKRLLEHDEDIVSGVYPNAGGKMMQIGAGFMAIHRRVLEAMMPNPFNPVELEGGVISGEDVGFIMNAKAKGFQVLSDQNIAVGHAKAQILRIVEGADRPVEYLSFAKDRPDPQGDAEVEVGLPHGFA